MERLVLTVGRGKRKYAEMALGLGRSLSLIGDDIPRAVITDLEGYNWSKHFDEVLRPAGPRSALDKLFGLELTGAESVLSIDGDCIAFRRLAPVFEYCKGKKFVVLGGYQSKGRWHGAEVSELCNRFGVDRVPLFNGGLIYYERCPETLQLIEAMKRVEAVYEKTGFEVFRGHASEEVCVLLAMLETGVGEVIPFETDFMNTGVGLVGKLTLDVMQNDCHFVCRRHAVRFSRPYIFHASLFSNYRVYWKQLDKLAWLDAYEEQHPYGYISPWGKLKRSVERRYLKYVLRKL